MEYTDEVLNIVFRNVIIDKSFAISKVNVIEIVKYYSYWDHFIYAPEDLFVEGYPVSWNKKNGMLNIDYNKKSSLKVKELLPAWVTVSE